MDTSFPQRGSKPARTSTDQRSPEPSQSSSPLWRALHPLIESSKVPSIDSYDRLGTTAIAISYQDVIRYEITDPELRIAVYAATELVGRSIPDEGTSSWILSAHSGVVNRRGQVFFVLGAIDAMPCTGTSSGALG